MEENNSDHLHTPHVLDEKKPRIGMQFASIEDAFAFYNQYAREAGFSTRMSKSKKDKLTNEVVWKQFVCFKEGLTDEARSQKRTNTSDPKLLRARGKVRTNCKARICFVKQQPGFYWSGAFQESHNHALATPSKVHLLRSHREVSIAKKALTLQFLEANIPTCQQMQLLEIEYGGPQNVGCTERDIRNFENTLKEEQKGIDA